MFAKKFPLPNKTQFLNFIFSSNGYIVFILAPISISIHYIAYRDIYSNDNNSNDNNSNDIYSDKIKRIIPPD
ncbi:hypothetical protein BMW23_1017 [Bodo saltans virus]|uniref:Transmembrane protein n=1 Tax=Bodo saltans virus TaxID=2024608 RepID=A0A2H4UVV1_9VIRU|nr:hypothetical protein QJ851_gp0999 [Bodo saltans virus]ATZ81062.1 hypothetical protein BMW23_1017 [Bodo saltans virus]